MPSHSLTRRHFWTASRSRSCSCPSALEALGDQAFGGCIGLTSLTVPDGVRKLPSWVFSSCQSLASLAAHRSDLDRHGCVSWLPLAHTEITIPDSVQSIGEMAFANMASPADHPCRRGATAPIRRSTACLTKAGDVLLAYPAARPGIRYDVPDGVTRIGEAGVLRQRPDDRPLPAEPAHDRRRSIEKQHAPHRARFSRRHGESARALSLRQQYQRRVLRRHRMRGTSSSGDEAYKFPLDVQVHYQTSMVVPRAADLFTDVDVDSWSYPGIDFCVLAGLMSGVGGDTSSPRGVTTRAQVADPLHLSGEPAVAGGTPFTDLTADWYQDAIAWAYQTGVVSGTSATTFELSLHASRSPSSSWAYAEQVLSMDLSADKRRSRGVPGRSKASPDWARDAVAEAVALGLISGAQTKDGTFLQPQGGATREQAATILMGFYTLVDGNAHPGVRCTVTNGSEEKVYEKRILSLVLRGPSGAVASAGGLLRPGAAPASFDGMTWVRSTMGNLTVSGNGYLPEQAFENRLGYRHRDIRARRRKGSISSFRQRLYRLHRAHVRRFRRRVDVIGTSAFRAAPR